MLIAVVLLTVVGANAQVKSTPKPKATVKPVSTQGGTTDDGKRVALKSDGSWSYDSTAATVTPAPTPVLIEAPVKPVARVTFHLLDTDLAQIRKTAGFTNESGMSSLLANFALKYSARELDLLRGATQSTYDRLMQTAVMPSAIVSTTTDFSGKGEFAEVPVGTYYLMSVSEIGRNVVLWNLKVEIKPGRNSVTLDQNNAAEAF